MINEKTILEKYNKITEMLIQLALSVTCMESCTSGMVSSLLTDTEGASKVFKGSIIAYSNETKVQFGLPESTIKSYGVYSNETAAAMARASRMLQKTDVGIGISGAYGNPDPANPGAELRSVYFAVDVNSRLYNYHIDIPKLESRYEYKLYTVDKIGDELIKLLKRNKSFSVIQKKLKEKRSETVNENNN